MRYWLTRLAHGVGFHKPIAATAARPSSPVRASSPADDQGGSIEPLTGGSLNTDFDGFPVRTPRSQFDVVCWRHLPEGNSPPSRLPPPPLSGTADAAGFAVRRVQSAEADDCGRGAFLLDLLPARPLRPRGRHTAVTAQEAQCPFQKISRTFGGPY